MSKMVTRCPQCQTSFRVTEEHLKIANGAVRCGSCLNVFQAKDHWVLDTPAASPSAAPAEKASPTRFTAPIPTPSFLQAADDKLAARTTAAQPAAATPTTPGKFQFDQAAIDTPPKSKFQFDQSSIDTGSAAKLLQEPDQRIPETALTKAHAKPIESLGDDDRISDSTPLEDEDDEDDHSTLSSSLNFGEAEDDYSSLFDDSDIADAESEDFEALLSGDFNDIDNLIESTPESDAPGKSDETWAKDLLDELRDEEKPAPVDLSQVENGRELLMDYTNPIDADVARRDLGLDNPAPFALGSTLSGKSRAADSGKPAAAQTATAPAPPAKHARAPVFSADARPRAVTRDSLIAHIEPAPVEIHHDTEDERPVWKTAIAEISICVILVLTLIAQHLFFNFPQLARNENTRPLLATVCNVFPCQLPPSDEWRNIKVSNLVVRQHATVTNGLIVDAILYNHASRELPFPKLELYFNDLEQLPIASRRFEPAEYLEGELSGKTMIPPGRPVHIAFEIVNPGEKAVNWRMDVTPFVQDK